MPGWRLQTSRESLVGKPFTPAPQDLTIRPWRTVVATVTPEAVRVEWRGGAETLALGPRTRADLDRSLKSQLAEGDGIIRRLTKIAVAARPSAAEPEPAPAAPKVSAAKAVAAAAEAFSERRRASGLAA